MKVFRLIYFWAKFPFVTFPLFGLHLIAYPLLTQILRVDHQGRFFHKLNSVWAQWIVKTTPGWQVEIKGFENLPTEAAVYTSNHKSMADIGVMFFLPIQFRWLSKDSVFRSPILGRCMRHAGYVSITRGNPDSHRQALTESAEWLQKGVSMYFFPEGTRNESAAIRPFKPGAFKLANDNQVPIVPIAISGASQMWRKDSWAPWPAKVRVSILPPTRKLENESIEDYAARVRDMIVKEYVTIHPGLTLEEVDAVALPQA